MSSVNQPRQKRSEETLAKILDACDTLSQEIGFEDLSMQAIARTAGVSVGNLYNRFRNKEDLIEHLVMRRQRAVAARIATLLAGDAAALDLRGRLTAVTRGLLEGLADTRALQVSAAQRLASGGTISDGVRGGADALVVRLTEWVRADDPRLDSERCRFAVATLAYAIQFNVIFGVATRTFGDELPQRLIDQAHAYIEH
ncbi:MAG: TetR/AcrR family transcriptional regulator [Pseudomonadota bacterium]